MAKTLTTIPNAKDDGKPGLSYGELSARHEDYDGDYWQEIEDFYVGGRQLAKRVRDYLPQLVNEGRARYEERLKSAGYVNYFGQIIGKIGACVCEQPLTIRPAADSADPNTPGEEPKDDVYAQFQSNTDGAGTSEETLLHEQLVSALKFRTSFVAVDFPRRPEDLEVSSAADADALGLGRPYAVDVPRNQVIDWDEDDDGGFHYLVIHRMKTRKAPPGEPRGTVIEEFKVWKKIEASEPYDSLLDFDPDGEDVDDVARAVWRLYRVEYNPKLHKPKPTDKVPLVDEGKTSFRRIPVLPMNLKPGLWAGNKIVGLAKEHWQRRTSLVSAENKNLVTIPVMGLGPEGAAMGTAMPSRVQQNARRGETERLGNLTLNGTLDDNGFMRTGKDDKIYYAEPSGSAYGMVDGQLTGLKEELHRVVDQMASSAPSGAQASKMLQSGASKAMDRSAEAIVYAALGHVVREYGLLIQKTISEARGEKTIWNAHGMDDYEMVDRDALVLEAQGMTLIDIPSVTFKKIYYTQIALALVENADVQTKETIRTEIMKGVVAESQMKAELDGKTHDSNLKGLDAKSADADRVKQGKPPIAQQRPGSGPGGGGRGGRGGRPPQGKGARP